MMLLADGVRPNPDEVQLSYIDLTAQGSRYTARQPAYALRGLA